MNDMTLATSTRGYQINKVTKLYKDLWPAKSQNVFVAELLLFLSNDRTTAEGIVYPPNSARWKKKLQPSTEDSRRKSFEEKNKSTRNELMSSYFHRQLVEREKEMHIVQLYCYGNIENTVALVDTGFLVFCGQDRGGRKQWARATVTAIKQRQRSRVTVNCQWGRSRRNFKTVNKPNHCLLNCINHCNMQNTTRANSAQG